MSKDLKPVVYYLLRRGWYGQAASACEAAMTKKGKEPVSLYWHAFALGMQGQLSDAIRELETFNSRRDLHYAMHVALLYFHRKAVNVDRETVSSLRAELSVSEDVTVSCYCGFVCVYNIVYINIYIYIYIYNLNFSYTHRKKRDSFSQRASCCSPDSTAKPGVLLSALQAMDLVM